MVAAKVNGWFDVDLTAYQIENPERGLFVAFCLLNWDYYVDQNAEKNHKGTGISGEYIKTPRLSFTQSEFKGVGNYSGSERGGAIRWHKSSLAEQTYLIRAVVAVD